MTAVLPRLDLSQSSLNLKRTIGVVVLVMTMLFGATGVEFNSLAVVFLRNLSEYNIEPNCNTKL